MPNETDARQRLGFCFKGGTESAVAHNDQLPIGGFTAHAFPNAHQAINALIDKFHASNVDHRFLLVGIHRLRQLARVFNGRHLGGFNALRWEV